jgi:hypothetical protein
MHDKSSVVIGVRDSRSPPRQQPPPPKQPPPNFRKPWKFWQLLGKMKTIRADLSENSLKSGNFIKILQTNLGKLSTTPTSAPYADVTMSVI